jgi:hypothetical protein
MPIKAFDGRERIGETVLQKPQYVSVLVLSLTCVCACRRVQPTTSWLPCGDSVQAISAAYGYVKSRPSIDSYLSLEVPPQVTESETDWLVSFRRKIRNVRPADLMFSVSKTDCSVDGPHGR